MCSAALDDQNCKEEVRLLPGCSDDGCDTDTSADPAAVESVAVGPASIEAKLETYE